MKSWKKALRKCLNFFLKENILMIIHPKKFFKKYKLIVEFDFNYKVEMSTL